MKHKKAGAGNVNGNKIDRLYSKLEMKYGKGEQNKRTAEQNALINTNFITGNQHIRFNPTTNVLEELPSAEKTNMYREREVFNIIRPLRNKILTIIKDKIPVPHAVPHSQSDQDQDSAKVTTAVLRDVFEKQKINKILKKIARDAVDVGPGFLQVSWDDKGGQVVMSDIDQMVGDMSVLLTEEEKANLYKQVSATGDLKNGDIKIEYVSMNEIYVSNPFEQEIEEQKWIIRAQAFDKKVAEAHYGMEFIGEESVGALTQQRNAGEYSSVLTRNLGVFSTESATGKVIIKEYYEKPTPKYPDGRKIVFGGGKIISEDTLPYINGDYSERTYPIIKVFLDTPGLFYSHAFIEDLKAVQRRYNQVRNRKYEYINKNVNGQIIIEEGALSDEQKITNKPGEIIWVKRGATPPYSMTSGNTNTLDVDSELSSLINETVSITGVSSLTQYGTPATSGIRGANMTQMLLEQDETRFALIIDSLSEAVVEMSKQIVRLYKQFMKPGEIRYSKYSSDLTQDVKWNRDLITEDIDIKNRAKLSTSEAQRKNDITQLMSSGLLTSENQLGPELTMRLLDQMNYGFAVDEFPIKGQADYKKAKRENRLIVNEGAQIVADSIDDHNIHLDIHKNFMKSEEYRKIVMVNPKIDELMRGHMMEHQQIIDEWRLKVEAEAAAMNSKNDV